jgi:hypothetical protein
MAYLTLLGQPAHLLLGQPAHLLLGLLHHLLPVPLGLLPVRVPRLVSFQRSP